VQREETYGVDAAAVGEVKEVGEGEAFPGKVVLLAEDLVVHGQPLGEEGRVFLGERGERGVGLPPVPARGQLMSCTDSRAASQGQRGGQVR
jgi:hypothetical protein